MSFHIRLEEDTGRPDSPIMEQYTDHMRISCAVNNMCPFQPCIIYIGIFEEICDKSRLTGGAEKRKDKNNGSKQNSGT